MKMPHTPVIVVAIVAIFGLTTATSATAATTASPATGFAAHATAYQNAVLDDAIAAHPGGVRVSTSEVKWPDGMVVNAATSPTAATPPLKGAATPLAAGCLGGDFCGWTGANYTGSQFSIDADTIKWIPFGECSPTKYPGCDSGVHAWMNVVSVRVWLEQDKDSGNELCIDPYDFGNWEESDYTGIDSDDYWWYISSNDATC